MTDPFAFDLHPRRTMDDLRQKVCRFAERMNPLNINLNTTRIVRHAPPDRASWLGAVAMIVLAAWSVWAWLVSYTLPNMYAPFAEARPYGLFFIVGIATGLPWALSLWLGRRPRCVPGTAEQQMRASVTVRVIAGGGAAIFWAFMFWMMCIRAEPVGGVRFVFPSPGALACLSLALRDGWSFLRITRQIGGPPPLFVGGVEPAGFDSEQEQQEPRDASE